MWMSGKPTDPGFYWHRDGPNDTTPTVILLDRTGVVTVLGKNSTVGCNEPLLRASISCQIGRDGGAVGLGRLSRPRVAGSPELRARPPWERAGPYLFQARAKGRSGRFYPGSSQLRRT